MTEDDDWRFPNDNAQGGDTPGIPMPEKDFVHLPDGSFHLAEGVIVSATQAAKISNNKKPTLVCKDTAQAIWGTDGLVNRSVSGIAAPKQRAAGELPKQPLTLKKVNIVTAAVRYWGQLKGDATATVASITKLLSEKIQDVRKSHKRLAQSKEKLDLVIAESSTKLKHIREYGLKSQKPRHRTRQVEIARSVFKS
ncbi:BEN domain-containing protein 5-like [Dermacentor variabilis]|uniref:BEN domain-containing protein 5-like n=1 Tax=Dermacentor variabilis TaxID=34621 RepID=UPI003F5CB41F